MLNSPLLSTLLLVYNTIPTTTLAYVSSPPKKVVDGRDAVVVVTKPAFLHLPIEDTNNDHDNNNNNHRVSPSRTTRTAYDLGLGKNAPVNNNKTGAKRQSNGDGAGGEERSATSSSRGRRRNYYSNTHEIITKYWNDYEAVNEYPNPNNNNNNNHNEKKNQVEIKSKPQQPIPVRLAQESVSISGAGGVDTRAKFQVNPTELDMNTLWVEMLIHHQQQQKQFV
eukprot:CAMPEP_0194234450 /NCGR_PEP_ID=MMETSP0158-20130606/2156_1 /TAXON_ID=33649 /ORGANISM="Thalassionema nitzschioides, Strain L26-B" /LENGTH=222 /DNA_ID=CAMNT_0038967619 /DNA_START=117 /DNA_END=782 /DNA_ORIENTATION=-